MGSDSTPASFHDKSWRLNTPDVSSELIGNEVVAIHLPTGLYYSIENVSATVWTAIEQGLKFEQFVQVVTSHYTVPPEQAEADLTHLLTELTTENLIVEAPASGAAPEPVSGEKQPYSVPKIEKFPDLQQLLMIDPIHEVDQRGWPHTKPE
jgi:hypothetical protein